MRGCDIERERMRKINSEKVWVVNKIRKKGEKEFVRKYASLTNARERMRKFWVLRNLVRLL
jgi:hypothetical protein